MVSGALSLIYQVAWVRGLTLLLGSTTAAITTVVAIFMVGLGLGSFYLVHRRSESANPLRQYALLELGIATAAAISPLLLLSFNSILSFLPNALLENDAYIALLRVLFASLLLLPATIAMGATLPILTTYLEQHCDYPLTRSAQLYGLNTVGACLGCLLAGFFLLPQIGLQNTLYGSAGANALLALLVWLLLPHSRDAQPKQETQVRLSTDSNRRALIVIAMLSFLIGAVGLICELVWIRLLILTIGGTTYAFSTTLAVYLFGYGIGAYYCGRLLSKHQLVGSLPALALCLLLATGSIALSLAITHILPDFYVANFDAYTARSSFGLLRLQVIPALVLLATPCILFGALFTLLLNQARRISITLQQAAALAYSFSTFGAIVGTVITTLWLVPSYGLEQTLTIASSAFVFSGILLLLLTNRRRSQLILAGFPLAGMLVIILSPGLEYRLLTAGVGTYTLDYQQQAREHNRGVLEIVNASVTPLFVKDGFTATVSVTQDLLTKTRDLYLATNGKIDGSSHVDMPTQKLLAHLPAAVTPEAKQACVIGLGTGTTVGALALHDSIRVEAVEIEPAIVEASQFFNDYNYRPLERPNVSLHETDARLHLLRKKQQYDLIISEPSNPWLAGVADLFTAEFYRISRDALTPRGTFAQWVQVYNLDLDSLKLVIRTFQSVYPDTYLAITLPGSDIMLLGFVEGTVLRLDSFDALFRNALIRQDLASSNVDVHTPEALASRIILAPAEVRAFAGTGQLNTDSLPLLSYRAPLSLFQETSLENTRSIIAHASEHSTMFQLSKENEQLPQLLIEQKNFLGAFARQRE